MGGRCRFLFDEYCEHAGDLNACKKVNAVSCRTKRDKILKEKEGKGERSDDAYAQVVR